MAMLDAELRRGLVYVVPYRARLAVILALNLAGTGLALYVPYLTRTLVDDGLLGRDLDALVRVVVLFVGVTVASFVLNFASGMRYTKVSAEILFDMRLAVYRHLQRLSPRFFARTPLGEIMSRINNDVSEIQRVLADTLLAWVGNVAFLVGTVGMLLWLDWRLFLAAAALLPPAIWALVRYRKRLEVRVRIMRERSASIGAFLIETLRGVRLIAASNAAEREAARFRGHNDAFVDSLMKMQRLRYLSGGLPGLLLSASTAVVFLYGGSRVIDDVITLGTLTAFMAYQMRLIGPVQGLMGLYTGLATARVSLRRVHELLDEPIEVVDAESPAALGPVRGELVFEDVSCGHGRGGAVLEGFGMRVAPGEVVALVGPSGGGKSTVADLIVRHIDPDSGRVLLDGRDVRDIRLVELRANVALVDQAAFIFNTSILENVRYARPDADEAAVMRAVERAGLGEFVAGLPDGLGTVVGEDGRQLSAGERQRVAIARALLADPAVLVLDEATSALDAAAEAHVVSAYREVMRGRTTVLITHREEMLRGVDRVVGVGGG
ncbi:MAG: ABC transporter ATP-binding protein [Gemmatimonadota bacterium]|nr:ABC transporter ATP-binding protein [Gemmatimonadota bacterium]MDE2864874.1 ABC transporter ATP-binding protein [Gemmatimonadota bacterium]